jgi:hypothetical protein
MYLIYLCAKLYIEKCRHKSTQIFEMVNFFEIESMIHTLLDNTHVEKIGLI